MISRIMHFITVEIWRIQLHKLSRSRSFLIKHFRIALLVIRGFNEDKCQLRASALTFYSLLSIVPVAAMAFGIAKGFGLEKLLEHQLIDKFPGQTEVMGQIINFSKSLLENTKGGMIAGIGVAILFWAVINVLSNIEKSFNDIWGVKKARNFGRKFSDYLSMMLICPILFIMASSVTVAIAGHAKIIVDKIEILGVIAPTIYLSLKFLPYCVIWALFSFIYVFMPNTKVNIRSGVIAGVIAGTAYQLVQWAYITFQIGASRYNAIYGSFAALPLFLVWLQVSWIVVLFGAEISFAHQNVDTYEFEPDSLLISQSFKKLLTLNIMHLLVKNFSRGERLWSGVEISAELEIPIRLARDILFNLAEAGLVTEVKDNDKVVTYQPGRDINLLTVKYVIDALEHRGNDDVPIRKTASFDRITESVRDLGRLIEKSPENLLLKDIP
ncbi:MAG: YihY/virulence factor BrkB family protein [Candidatus Omnitrophica bacterium]|nr:YihY/virulence factor BrkB family protein [Candidatus Omnitrophota bacterium]MBU4149372.1 YihY/virulence factor BrkB family protein [Candidatus Omnitrophota bacterium]